VWNSLRNWIFPVCCLECAAPRIAFCSACAPPPAARITEVVAGVGLSAVGPYAGSFRRAIVAMKRGERAYLDPFAGLLAGSIVARAPLVPLPTSRRRRALRGFDQAVELARRTAAIRGSACCDVLVKRGAAQRGLDRRARLEAGGRFKLRSGRALPEVAIVVDDVCTTGATLMDGIATLRRAGVAVIGAVVLARTVAGRNSQGSNAVLAHGHTAVRGADLT
jgi:predicted amidophosphoribosyltransferase